MDDFALFGARKFRAPLPPASALGSPAPRLIDAALRRAGFVLLVAPAGSGKTTALAGWARAHHESRRIWIGLDSQDDDLHTLARAIETGIRGTVAAGARRLTRLLASGSPPELRQIAGAMTLDLDDLGDTVVILDDLQHVQDRSALGLLEALLDDLGPCTRVVAASRVEPQMGLAARRVRRQIADIAVVDLRMDLTQIEALLAEVGRADPDVAEEILHRSGGWAAAVVLMVGNVASEPPGGAGAGPSASFGASELEIDSFLRSEILDRAEPSLRQFLLESSLLDDLDADVCTAVTGEVKAEARLEEARRRGLIEWTVPEGPDAVATLRYHDRIAAFLRSELVRRAEPELLATLRRRAAAVSGPLRSADLLLEAGAVEAAAEVVAVAGRSLVESPGGRVPRSWLARFDSAQTDANPGLSLLSGLAAIEDGDFALAATRLEPVVGTMRDRQDRTGLVRSAYGLAEVHLARGDVEAASPLIEELLALDTTADDRVRVLLAKTWLDYFSSDWAAIAAALDECFTLAFTRCSDLGRDTLGLGLGTEFLFTPLGARWLLDRIIELAKRGSVDVMAATSLELLQAAAHVIGGRLREAEALTAAVDDRALELGGLSWLAVTADRVRLGVALLAEDHPEVDRLVDSARRLLSTSERHHQERGMYAYAAARSGRLRGRPDQVRAGLLLLADPDPGDRPDSVVTRAVIESMVACDEGDLDAAADVLLGAREISHGMRFCFLTGIVDLELAAIDLARGRTPEAIATARPTLELLAGLEGIGLLRLDGRDTHAAVLQAGRTDPDLAVFCTQALAALAQPGSSTRAVVPQTGQVLSVRELEVLRAVVEGASNREIAESLFIGERTVKSHMTSLMRKLGVGSRTAAAARARALGLA